MLLDATGEHVASSSDVDNEATAELPVLDVAAYEATLNDPTCATPTPGPCPPRSSWRLPCRTSTRPSIPTLRPAEPDSAMDAERHARNAGAAQAPNKIIKATADVARCDRSRRPSSLPPSPPLIEELRKALAAAERRIEELNERARIADAERAVAIGRAQTENAQLRAQLGDQLESLHTARGRLGVQGADQSALEDELFARADRIDAAAGASWPRRRRRSTEDPRRARGQRAALRAPRRRWHEPARRARAPRQPHRDSRSRSRRAPGARGDAQGAARTMRWPRSIRTVPDLRAELEARDRRIAELTRELAATMVLATEKDADLQVAEESIRNLEIEVRDKTGKLEEVSVTVEEWRAVIAESQRSILQRDTRIQQLEADLEKRAAAVAADSAAQTGEEIALEGPARVLIRTDGNTDFVHVLGRRTRIGRGSDNELVLDTKHISRYHAVLLAGPVHTSIEDLNSTNGVFVNGKRVSRQVLKDGDRVTIGQTQFRYTVRD